LSVGVEIQSDLTSVPGGAIGWRGPFSLDESGYADESRHFVEILDQLGLDVEAVELTRAGESRSLRPSAARPNLYVFSCPWPDFEIPADARYVVWRTMYETDQLPDGWVERACEVDEVWVPSDFSAQTFSAAGVPTERVKLLAAPIDLDRFQVQNGPTRRPEPFTFLSVFRWQYRKGWDVLLSAYFSEFSTSDDTHLIMHVLPLKADAPSPASQIADVLGVTLGERHPSLEIRTDPLTRAQVPNLYREADCFVLASRGEGCGRPYMEAMASGLPTIGTRWSGNLAFMSDRCSLLVDADVVPVSPDAAAEWPLFAGHSWAEPDKRHLSELMRSAYEMSFEERRCLGLLGRESVDAYGSTTVVTRQLIGHIARIADELRQ
jgi:glycosyltransferase involved in cell wall biosynthesis